MQGNEDNTEFEMDIREQHDRNSTKNLSNLKVSCKIYTESSSQLS